MEILKILVLFFAIIGVVQCLIWCKRLLLRPKGLRPARLTVPLRGHVDNAEQIIRYYYHQMQSDPFGVGDMELILEDCGVDDGTREICERFARDYTGVQFYSPQEEACRLD
ncbi:MAG: hypothetical protein ACLRVT_00030 [Oscillospiraceae bacterium]